MKEPPSEQPTVGLTVVQAAAMLQLNKETVLKLLRNGQLHGRRIGKPWRIHPAAIDEFLMEKKPPARADPLPTPTKKPATWKRA